MLALVTGANRGLGAALARALCEDLRNSGQDGTILIGCRNLKHGHEVALSLNTTYGQGKAAVIELDVSKDDSVAKAANEIKGKWGYLDLLVNNAAYATMTLTTRGPYPDGTADLAYETIYKGVIRCTESFLPLLKPRGRILNVQTGLTGMVWPSMSLNRRRFFEDPSFTLESLSKLASEYIQHVKDGRERENGWPESLYSVLKIFMKAYTEMVARNRAAVPDNAIVIMGACPGFVKTDATFHHSHAEPVEAGAQRLLKAAKMEGDRLNGAFIDKDGKFVEFPKGDVLEEHPDYTLMQKNVVQGQVENVASVVLKAYPIGIPNPEKDFETTHKANIELSQMAPGNLLISNCILSLDPYMRTRMIPRADAYISGFKIGDVLSGHCVGKVEKSTYDPIPTGSFVTGFLPWQTQYVLNVRSPENPAYQVRLVSRDMIQHFPLSNFVGVLGMPGMTAWQGLEICQIQPGETLFVSAASGAVGQLVGQLARLRGANVIGCAGSDRKVEFLRERHFSEAFNYKNYPTYESMVAKLRSVCPAGIDAYFDNVGGMILDAALACCNRHARFAACGMISQYNSTDAERYSYKNLFRIIDKQVRMEGFIVSEEGKEEFWKQVPEALRKKQIIYKDDVVRGPISDAPAVLVRMLMGENFGKQCIQIRDYTI